MSPQAQFSGGGPIDGDQRDLPGLPATYETIRDGQVWVYQRQGESGGVTVYRLKSHRSAR